MRKIKMDIKTFGVPSPRSGSIDAYFGHQTPPMDGQEIHVIIQKILAQKNPSFEAEKAYSLKIEMEKFDLLISGRVDGVMTSPAFEIIEIKTAFDIDKLYKLIVSNLNHPYVWQLKTYGYIHYKIHGEIPKLKMKLVSQRNIKKYIDLEIDFDLSDYNLWLTNRLIEIKNEVTRKEKLLAKRKKIAPELVFPFTKPRLGQAELLNAVETHFNQGIPLLIQAPTGLGKTVGILFPAIKESFSRGQKTVYVTPKNSQHQVAEEAIDQINKSGGRIKRLTLTSKKKLCFKAEPMCNPDACEYAKSFYDKLEEHDLLAKMRKTKKLNKNKFLKWGEEYKVCPFELSLESMNEADVIICDYNYVFSLRSLITKLSEPLLDNNAPNLIIDEAHNLPARAKDYFSPKISTSDILEIEAALLRLPQKFASRAQNVTAKLKELINSYKSQGEAHGINIVANPFIELETEIRQFCIQYLESNIEIIQNDPILRLSNLLNEFVAGLELNGPEFFHSYQKNNSKEILKITCADARGHLALAYKEFKNTAAFSATLKPFNYYQELLGLPQEKTKFLEFNSPFDRDNKKVILIPQISTKYKDRNLSAPKIIEVFQKILPLKKGNYLALFPSFEFLDKVIALLNTTSLPSYNVLIQERNMNLNKTNNFLNELKGQNHPTLLLGVQGGVFSEGVDYPGEMLIGVFIIGPALPNFDFEREEIKKYYGNVFGAEVAFNYAYVYPAMAKAIQSAGRVIRTETDRGLIVMLDARFLEKSYAEAMPLDWFTEDPKELISQKILSDISLFWDEEKINEAK